MGTSGSGEELVLRSCGHSNQSSSSIQGR
jgi:hypothetical protein